MEYPGGGNVDQQTAYAHKQHGPALHVHLFGEGPVIRLKEYPARNEPETEGVGHGCQHLRTVVAEGALGGRLSLAEPHGNERHDDGRGVGQHMAGVRE